VRTSEKRRTHVIDGGLLRHHRTGSMTDNSYVPSRLSI
jgi:hypothetical protein